MKHPSRTWAVRSRALVCAAATVMAATLAPATASADTVTFGTIAPKQSIWGKVLQVWQAAVKKKTDGTLELEVFYNGTQGDDATMIGKLKSGQLDGAAVSSIGLAKVHKPMLVLQLPGVFRTWEALDKARDSLNDEFVAAAEKEGYYVSIGDIGRLRGMSKGFAVRTPADLAGKNVLSYRHETMGPALWQMVEKVNLVEKSPTEVLPTLKTKGIDFMSAPMLAAEQLQWVSQLDHISSESAVMAIAGTVWSKKRIDGLPADVRAILMDTGKIAGAALRKKVREADDAAFVRASEKMTVVTPTAEERKTWESLFKRTIEKLKQGTFSPELVEKVVAMGG